MWDAASGQLRATLQPPAKTYSMDFAGCGHILITAGEDWVVRVWDVASGVESRQVDTAPGTDSLMLGADGRFALTSSQDGTLRLWDVMAGHERTPLPTLQWRFATVNSEGTKLATVSGKKTVEIWSIAAAPAAATGDVARDDWCARCGAE